MRRAAAIVALAVTWMGTAPVAAGAAPAAVNVQFQAFAPSETEVLPGETVQWSNVSERIHTVTAGDGSFDSGELAGGAAFSHVFEAVGSFPYHCTLHPTMTGTVNVERVILDSLPPAPVPAGQRVEFTGRSADPAATVAIERDTGSGGFVTVARAKPTADGTWAAPVIATGTGDYRASVGAEASQTRRLLVIDRTVQVRATRRGVHVTVLPPLPNGTVVLQLHLRDRFGWWPAARVRLDYLSRADFSVGRRALARVALVGQDGWTPVATSPELRVGSSQPATGPRAPRARSDPPSAPKPPATHAKSSASRM